MKNVFIVNPSYEYVGMFAEAGFTVISDINQADLVCFTGGEDVSPHLYNEHTHPRTYSSFKRDAIEKAFFTFCRQKEIPMVGICRGGQFLNVKSGGRMYQHVTNHTRYHTMVDLETNEKLYVSSTHHQMMRPSAEATILAVADEGGTKEHMSDLTESAIIKHDAAIQPDIEVVFYPSTKCLCFQPHPEFGESGLEDMRTYFFSLINKYLK